jgi:predicted component of viral defense system (DUF524 family)
MAVSSAKLRLLSPTHRPVGTLTIELLPKTKDDPDPLLDLSSDPDRDLALEPIQLLEGIEYLYAVALDAQQGAFAIEPKELFYPDRRDGNSGRLRPGLSTGSVPVTVYVDGAAVGHAAFEVRSSKLDYLTTYRSMLRDLGDWFTELVMERFGPTEQGFRLDQTHDAATLYQRFAFLKSLIGTEEFEAAIQQILSRPHRRWVEELERRQPGQAIPASAAVIRQLTRPGPRVAWPGAPSGHPLQSLPSALFVGRTEESLDTPENRFVRFVLERWQEILLLIMDGLRREQRTNPVVRGVREVEAMLSKIEEWLSAPLFDEVGRLRHLPANSQVLQKRSGYRDLFRAFIQVETAATLSWDASEDLYKAGQRDVAALYEFWVFYQVAQVIADLTGVQWDASSLLETRPDGLGIRLRRGQRQALTATVLRLGRPLLLRLYFNRTFSKIAGSSWTRPMRPDLSLWIGPEKGSGASFEPVWIHFDAKYRVESISTLFGAMDRSALETEEVGESRGQTLRTDLLKMHAYRDAIRRSAGAYVIYPGDLPDENQQYDEILPGLGAFPLRPTADGDVTGTARLTRFIDDVLTHVASQATQHERSRHWETAIHTGKVAAAALDLTASPFLTKPPADTKVLVGFVTDRRHLAWILEQGLYNLRAYEGRGRVGIDFPGFEADLLLLQGLFLPEPVLFRVQGAPQIHTKASMERLGYPRTPRELYFCLPISEPLPLPHDVKIHIHRWISTKLRNPLRTDPLPLSWLKILEQTTI